MATAEDLSSEEEEEEVEQLFNQKFVNLVSTNKKNRRYRKTQTAKKLGLREALVSKESQEFGKKMVLAQSSAVKDLKSNS